MVNRAVGIGHALETLCLRGSNLSPIVNRVACCSVTDCPSVSVHPYVVCENCFEGSWESPSRVRHQASIREHSRSWQQPSLAESQQTAPQK